MLIGKGGRRTNLVAPASLAAGAPILPGTLPAATCREGVVRGGAGVGYILCRPQVGDGSYEGASVVDTG